MGASSGKRLARIRASSSQYSTTVTIRDGVISGQADRRSGTYTISGTASPDGRFEWRSSGGKYPGSFQASVSGERGQGDWSNQWCSGVLTIQKK